MKDVRRSILTLKQAITVSNCSRDKQMAYFVSVADDLSSILVKQSLDNNAKGKADQLKDAELRSCGRGSSNKSSSRSVRR
jgi:hypothetical protein